MNILKKFIICFVCAACFISLSSCGGGDDDPSMGSTSSNTGTNGSNNGNNNTNSGSNNGDNNGSGGNNSYIPKTYNTDLTLTADAGSKTITIKEFSTAITNAICDKSWLSLVPEDYTSGSPSITINLSANTERTERSCTVTIIATNGDKITVNVIQKGRDATPLEEPKNEYSNQEAFAKSGSNMIE